MTMAMTIQKPYYGLVIVQAIPHHNELIMWGRNHLPQPPSSPIYSTKDLSLEYLQTLGRPIAQGLYFQATQQLLMLNSFAVRFCNICLNNQSLMIMDRWGIEWICLMHEYGILGRDPRRHASYLEIYQSNIALRELQFYFSGTEYYSVSRSLFQSPSVSLLGIGDTKTNLHFIFYIQGISE